MGGGGVRGVVWWGVGRWRVEGVSGGGGGGRGVRVIFHPAFL